MISPKEWSKILVYFTEGFAKDRNLGPADPPTPDQFSVFFNFDRLPSEVRLQAAGRLNLLLAILKELKNPERAESLLSEYDDDHPLLHLRDGSFFVIRQITSQGMLEALSLGGDEKRLDILRLEEERSSLPSNIRPHSFLIPLIEAWVTQPKLRPVDPEKRRTQILPEAIRYAVPTQAALPMPPGDALPELGPQPARTSYLPGLEPPPGVVVPVLPLPVAKVSTAGAGAAITPRLWFGCQMGLPLDRRTGEEVRLPFTVREVGTWLWPNGWNRRRDLPRLRKGLRDLYHLGVIWGQAEWLLVRPVKIPTVETSLDDYLLIDVTALRGSDRGPLIDTQRLWHLGVLSGIPWRIWIRLAYIWDYVKVRNGGNRVYATRPEVKRGERGVILDSRGRPILDQQNRPVLDWSDKRAIRTGRQEPHPQAGKVPTLDMRDLALLGFDDADVPAGTLRRRASETRTWLTRMEKMGVVALEHEGKEIRVLETYPELGTNKAPLPSLGPG